MGNERLGEIRLNKYGTPMKIIEYKCADDITIKFLDVYERERKTTYSNFKSGCVRNPYDRNVKNVGFMGEGKILISKNQQSIWRIYLQMLLLF